MLRWLSVIVVLAVVPGRVVCSNVSVNTVDVLTKNSAGRQVCDCPSTSRSRTVCEAEMGTGKGLDPFLYNSIHEMS